MVSRKTCGEVIVRNGRIEQRRKSRARIPYISDQGRLAVTAHRLRCAKALAPSTPDQIGEKPSAQCDICNVHGDVLHILQSCKKYERERKQWITSCRKTHKNAAELQIRMKDAYFKQFIELIQASKLQL